MKSKKKNYILILIFLILIVIFININRIKKFNKMYSEDFIFLKNIPILSRKKDINNQKVNSIKETSKIKFKENSNINKNINVINETKKVETYKFNVKYGNSDFIQIKLTDTIENKNNSKEKIAPRNKWKF